MAQNLKKSSRSNADDIKQMIVLYKSGLTLEAVGARFGISKQRISQIFSKAGLKKRPYTKSKKFINSRKSQKIIVPKEKLIELYKYKKLPVCEIIKTLKTSTKVFYRSLDFHRISRRRDEAVEHLSLKRELLRCFYIEEDLTATEIARRLNCATITVRKRLSEFGIRKSDFKNKTYEQTHRNIATSGKHL